MMERITPLGQNWKKSALSGALVVAAIAGGHSMTRHAGPEGPTQSQAEDPPQKGDYMWQMMSKHQGIHAAEHNLKQRQQEHQGKIDLRAQNNEQAAGEVE